MCNQKHSRYTSGAYPGGLWGPRAPGVTKGAPKKKKRKGKGKGKEEREKKKEEKKEKKKGGNKKRKDRKVNQYNERGAIQGWIKSGRKRRPPIFSEIGRLTLCGRLREKMHQIVQIDFENQIFSPLLRGHIPLRHPLLVLKFGRPLFPLNSWTISCHSSASRDFRGKTSWAPK